MSYQVIARKYRPQVFEEVVGQKLVTETLANAIRTNRVAHGYIFSGARGVGKTTTARILAKALNCVNGPTVAPCGKCPSCTEIAAGNSVDVLEIDAASNRGIDEIRGLRESVRYLPARDRYRVFIIDEVHMLTTEAFNALLKTLEEPPPRSLFILATTEAHKLPATIQSRCQHFAFRLLDYQELAAQLGKVARAEGLEASEDALGVLAQAAEGSLRDALSLLDQAIAACGTKLDEVLVRQMLGAVPALMLAGMMEAVAAGDAARVLELISKLAREGYELTHFLGEFTRFVRNLMVAKTAGAASPLLQVPNEERQELARLAELASEEDLTRYLAILLRTESDLRYALEPRFHLELGMLKLVHARRLASIESLLAELSASGRAKKPAEPGGSGETRSALAASTREDPPPSREPKIRQPIRLPSDQPTNAASRPAAPLSANPPAPSDERETAGPPLADAGFAVARHAGLPTPRCDPRLEAIKAEARSRPGFGFLSGCLEQLVGFRAESGEVHFPFGKKVYADWVSSGDLRAKLESVSAQVFGQPMKVCVTLQEQAESSARRPGARERALRDKMVEAFTKTFDAALAEVEDLSQE